MSDLRDVAEKIAEEHCLGEFTSEHYEEFILVLESALCDVHNAAIEEAAKVVETRLVWDIDQLQRDIRALKEAKP